MTRTLIITASDAPATIDQALRQLRGSHLVDGLATDGHPDDPYPVPGEDTFLVHDEDQEEPRVLEYAPARDLEEIAAALTERHKDLLFPLSDYTLRFLWRRQGGASNGATVFGKCQKMSGMLRYWSDADFVVWLAADHVRDNQYTRFQVEALLFHELLYAEIDMDSGKPGIRPHDAELFLEEMLRYGLWDRRLTNVGESVRQLPLMEGE